MEINNIIQTLSHINDTLGEIYTKGDDSILLVRCRQLLYNIINEYQYSIKVGEEKIHYFNENEKINNNEDKKE